MASYPTGVNRAELPMYLGGSYINTRTWMSSGAWRMRWRQVTSLKPDILKRVYIVVKMFGKWMGGILGACCM